MENGGNNIEDTDDSNSILEESRGMEAGQHLQECGMELRSDMSNKTKKKKKLGFYAVRNGKTVGIFDSWTDAGSSVIGHKHNNHRAWPTLQDAVLDLLNGGMPPECILVYKHAIKKPMSVKDYCRMTGMECQPVEKLAKAKCLDNNVSIHRESVPRLSDEDVADLPDHDEADEADDDAGTMTNTGPLLLEILQNTRTILKERREVKEFEALVVDQFSTSRMDAVKTEYKDEIARLKSINEELESRLTASEAKIEDQKKEKLHLEACLAKKNYETDSLKSELQEARNLSCVECKTMKRQVNIVEEEMVDYELSLQAMRVQLITVEAELSLANDRLHERELSHEILQTKLDAIVGRENHDSVGGPKPESEYCAMRQEVKPNPGNDLDRTYLTISDTSLSEYLRPEEVDLLIVGISHVGKIRPGGLFTGKNVKRVCLKDKSIRGALDYIQNQCSVLTKRVYLHALDNDVLSCGVDDCLDGLEALVACCKQTFGPDVQISVSEILPRTLRHRGAERRYMRDAAEINHAMRDLKSVFVVRQQSLYDRDYRDYRRDGVHLTTSGLSRYVRNLKSSLQDSLMTTDLVHENRPSTPREKQDSSHFNAIRDVVNQCLSAYFTGGQE